MYEIFAKLLKEQGVTPYQVSKATGVAQSSLSDWKNGKSKPKYEKMVKIADYFNVSVDYLLTGEQKETAPAEAEADDDEMADLLETIRRRPDLKILFSLSKKATPEDVRKTVQIIKTICGDDNGADNF
jgi:Predicted transcriptional regulators